MRRFFHDCLALSLHSIPFVVWVLLFVPLWSPSIILSRLLSVQWFQFVRFNLHTVSSVSETLGNNNFYGKGEKSKKNYDFCLTYSVSRQKKITTSILRILTGFKNKHEDTQLEHDFKGREGDSKRLRMLSIPFIKS